LIKLFAHGADGSKTRRAEEIKNHIGISAPTGEKEKIPLSKTEAPPPSRPAMTSRELTTCSFAISP
jgi:hypothetical protein